MTEAQPHRKNRVGLVALAGIAPIWGYSWVVSKVALGYAEPLTFIALDDGCGRRVPLPRAHRDAAPAAPAAVPLDGADRPAPDGTVQHPRHARAQRRRSRQGLGAGVHDVVLAAASRLAVPGRTTARPPVAGRLARVRRPRPRRAPVGHRRRARRHPGRRRRTLLGGRRTPGQADGVPDRRRGTLADHLAAGGRQQSP